MESISPFELDALRRVSVGELAGGAFYRRVLDARAELEPVRGAVIIGEEDPVAFAVLFFAAASVGLPLVLTNPYWGASEREQFERLMLSAEPAAGSILIPTGGTTGGVKLAIHDWASLAASAQATQEFVGGPVHACCRLPLHHVSGLMQLVRAYVSGGSIRFDNHATDGRCLSLVPPPLQRWMQSHEGLEKIRSAQHVFVGGAAMPESLRQQARALRLPLVPVYGMTETAAMIAVVPSRSFLEEADPGARLLGDTRIHIDPDGAIRIFSRSLFKGYHAGETVDPRAGYRSGDAGWLDGEGCLHVIGRMDGLINSGGEKVDPAEVRAALLQIEGVAQARVVGEPDEEWGEVVVAYVQTKTGATPPTEAGLLRLLKQQLSPYKIPKSIRIE